MLYENLTQEVKTILQGARRVAVLTGAGVSAESGVPTFRGGGQSAVWRGFPFEQISSAEMLGSNPTLVWEWFSFRREAIRAVRPNPAHEVLARWQDRFEEFTLVTQNIDDLHREAGSRNVAELHGNIWRVRCLQCGQVTENREAPLAEIPPRCVCRGILRPDVVLFGEILPQDALQRGYESAARCDVYFVIGTSGVVYPAAHLPLLAKRSGAVLVEVNPEATPLTSLADFTILGKAAQVLSNLEGADVS